MKTKLLSGICAAIAMSCPATEAQTPKAADARPAPVPQIEIESKFFTVSASASERLGLVSAPGEGGAAWRGKLSKIDFEKLLQILAAEKSMNMLSAPRVTTKSGQRAVIEVIREFRYPTAFEQGDGVRLSPKAFETRNVGIALDIQPTVGEGDLIDLQAMPSLTGFRGFVGYAGGKTEKSEPIPRDGFSQPIFDKMSYSLSATLRSEQTLVFGGFPWMGSNEILADPMHVAFDAKPEANPQGEPKLMFVTLTARLRKTEFPPGHAANEIKEGEPVEISAQLVNMTRDQLTAEIWPKEAGTPSETGMGLAGVFDPAQAEAMRKVLEKASGSSLSSGPAKAIASDERYSVDATGLLRYLGKKGDNGAKETPAMADSLQTERLHLQLNVEARAGPGNVIDLNIAAILKTSAAADADAAPDPKAGISSAEWKWRKEPLRGDGRVVTTSLSMFDRSTAILVRASEGRQDHIQILLITAKGTPGTTGPTAPELLKQTTPAAAAGGQKWPSAVPVPGRPGFVISPYAPEKGLVDVRGFPSGTEVKCPYSGKMFLVP